MSFILDALKKSEIERQRQTIPGLVDSGIVAARPRLPVWAVAVGGLLAMNLLVLMFVLARGWLFPSATALQAPPATAAAPAASRGATPPSEAANTHFSPLDAPPQYAPEIPVETASEPSPAPGAKHQESAAPHAAHRRDPLLSDENAKANDYKPVDDEALPTINEISLTGAQALPELHLDVHVFATQPAERFVYVNMRKYHEGATLQEGPTVERIRRDGVVLDYQGLRFLLPRQ